jgi:hypothetical protein
MTRGIREPTNSTLHTRGESHVVGEETVRTRRARDLSDARCVSPDPARRASRVGDVRVSIRLDGSRRTFLALGRTGVGGERASSAPDTDGCSRAAGRSGGTCDAVGDAEMGGGVGVPTRQTCLAVDRLGEVGEFTYRKSNGREREREDIEKRFLAMRAA